MPTVSVVIPTFNRADILPRAIDSVLAQTESDFELLVVDDGSTDDTQAVLDAYDDPRLRVEAHGTNRGGNVARNTGIEHARGTYVAFLDSDDEWLPTKLELQLAALDDRSDAWVGAYCDSEIRTPGTTGRLEMFAARVLSRADTFTTREGGEELIGEILADNVSPGAGSSLLVRTDVARDIGGFDETLDRFQDPEIVLRILQQGKLAYIDDPLVVRHETGTPDAETVKTANDQYLAEYAETIARLEDDGFDIHGSHNLLLAKIFYTEGQFLAGTRHLRDASIPARHVPGVLWSIGTGVRRRPRSALVLVGMLLLGLFAVKSAFA